MQSNLEQALDKWTSELEKTAQAEERRRQISEQKQMAQEDLRSQNQKALLEGAPFPSLQIAVN